MGSGRPLGLSRSSPSCLNRPAQRTDFVPSEARAVPWHRAFVDVLEQRDFPVVGVLDDVPVGHDQAGGREDCS